MKPTKLQKKQKQGFEVKKFLTKRFKVERPVQKNVINELAEYSQTNNVKFSTKLLKYLMGEIRTPQQIQGLSDSHIMSTLRTILQGINQDDEKRDVVGKKTLNRVINQMEDGCPRPWC